MKKQTILKKAIEKAVKGGWKHTFSFMGRTQGIKDIYGVCLGDDGKLNKTHMSIIFSHSFAKAFWGEEYVEVGVGSDKPVALQKEWRANLQKMALAKDRIKYLEKFI